MQSGADVETATGGLPKRYLLGRVTFYQLVTGQLPFRGETIEELHRNKIVKTPAPVNQLNRAIAPSLAAVIHKILSPNPEERYASPMELLEHMQGQDAFLVTQMGAGGHAPPAAPQAASACGDLHVQAPRSDGRRPGESGDKLSPSVMKWSITLIGLLQVLVAIFAMVREWQRSDRPAAYPSPPAAPRPHLPPE